MSVTLQQYGHSLASQAAVITAASPNEENLRAEVEKVLEQTCQSLGIPWTAYQLDRTLRTATAGSVRFADVAHGAVVIEYEPPNSFGAGRAGAVVRHAQDQAEEYAVLLAVEEGRPLGEYQVIAWDGAHISFGRHDGMTFTWEPVTPFDDQAASRLLSYLNMDGAPLVHPALLSQLVGPESALGGRLLPKLFNAAVKATSNRQRTSKTLLLFTEWRRLFGQVVGTQSDQLQRLLETQGRNHSADYGDNVPAYLFALNTYIALVAKLVAAMALPGSSQNLADPATPIGERIEALENGQLFADAGVLNMLNGDFFAWYRDDADWGTYEDEIDELIATLSVINFDVSRKKPESTRDLFKGLYMQFVPRPLRHALGEYYTPDWLAAHALDILNWQPEQGLGDPTCGSGTFILEALKRRVVATPEAKALVLLDGLWGLDLNPLAVLSARASLVVFLADKLDPAYPVRLPVFLADAINPAIAVGSTYTHTIQTEKGARQFRVPRSLVEKDEFFAVMGRARELIDGNYTGIEIYETITVEFDLSYVDQAGHDDLLRTFDALVDLHSREWNGIWCAILADRFAAGAIPPSSFIAGNPPWVKWSHLPVEYAEFIKDRCLQLGVFSVDRWVGGIESDISTVITYETVDKYLVDGGTLAFFITGSVFANESSQGFRRWRINSPPTDFQVQLVEDYAAVAPFEGVTNHATLLVVIKGQPTEYPVSYRVWTPPRNPQNPRFVIRAFTDSKAFRSEATSVELEAYPVPGTDAGPWLKGTRAQHEVWKHLFGYQQPAYGARKGVTTDANGIFFVKAVPAKASDLVTIENDPSLGRKPLPVVRRLVEKEYLYPLLRGKGVTAFKANVDPDYRIVVPQRGRYGIEDLPRVARRTHQWLRNFEDVLRKRSSFKRFQERAGAPWWSLWSTGPYTFSDYKVLWREMSGSKFAAAYVGRVDDPLLGNKLIIPDHKLYFVPCDTEDEAAYLTGFLNAPLIAGAISAYAAQLSLGASVVEYLLIPKFDPTNRVSVALAALAKQITVSGGNATPDELAELDTYACEILSIPDDVRAAVDHDTVDPSIQAAEAAVAE